MIRIAFIFICVANLIGCTMLIDALHLPKKWHVAATLDKHDIDVTIWDSALAGIPDYAALESRIDAWVATPTGDAEAIRGWEIRIVRFPFWCGKKTSKDHGYCNALTDYQRKLIITGIEFQSLEHELDHVTQGPNYGKGHEDAGPQ